MPNGKRTAPKGLEPNGAPDDKLTPKQRLFVENYLKTKNGVRSAEAAGYKGSYLTLSSMARENLEKPLIKAAIQAGMQAQISRVQISHDDVLAWLQEIRERSMQHEPVLDRQGQPTGEYRYDSNGALRASELIGKHIGMWRKEEGDGEGEDIRTKRNERRSALEILRGFKR